MKKFFNWGNLNISLQAFFVLAALLTLFFIYTDLFAITDFLLSFLGATSAILMPFIIGFSIAFLLNSPMISLEKKMSQYIKPLADKNKIKRMLALLITYLVFIGVLIWFLIIVLPQFYQSLLKLLNQLARGYSEYQEEIENVAEALGVATYLDLVMFNEIDFSDYTEVITKVLPFVLSKAYSFTSTVFKFVMGIIISVYVLYDKERFISGGRKIVAVFTPEKDLDRVNLFLSESNHIFKSFFIGKTLDSIIIGILCFIGLIIMKNPYSIVIAVIVGITNMIPYFGPFIGAVPGVAITLIYDPVMALWLTLFIFLLQQFDGLILGPKILGDSTGIEPFWVLLAIIVGGALFGVLGMLLGVPVFAVIYNVSKKVINRKYEEKMQRKSVD